MGDKIVLDGELSLNIPLDGTPDKVLKVEPGGGLPDGYKDKIDALWADYQSASAAMGETLIDYQSAITAVG